MFYRSIHKQISGLICLLLLYFFSYDVKAEELTLNNFLKELKKNHPIVLQRIQKENESKFFRQSVQGNFDTKLSVDQFSYHSGLYNGNRGSVMFEQPLEFQGVNLFSGYKISRGNFPIYDDQFLTREGGQFLAGFDLPLLRDRGIDNRRASLRLADLDIVRERQITLYTTLLLEREATVNYLNWIATGKKLKIAEELLAVAKERGGQLERRAAAGEQAMFDVIDNNRAIQQREAQVISAKAGLREAAIGLSVFMVDQDGKPYEPSIKELPKNFPLLTFEYEQNLNSLIDETIKRRPDLKELSMRLEKNLIEIDLARNQKLPRLRIKGGISDDLGEEANKRSSDPQIITGINFEFPLQNNFASGQLLAAEAQRQNLQQQLINLKNNLKADLEKALINIKAAKERIIALEKELRFAEEVAIGERERLIAGESSILFVNLREQTIAESAARLIDANFDLHRYYADYIAVTGLSVEN
ncbi:MAG TPA: TolC family protein [Oligoflexia bacterium]|nr:TolC family protein [Oligoflexia bacterium]HMP26853.1 TolC family protein [Oligoflexia bacterium]